MERWRRTESEHWPWLDISSRRRVGRRRCLLLYSHDTYGLGHLRRNSAIAHAVRRRDPDVRIVMLTGSSLAGSWHLPADVEVVKMPSVVKVGADDYRPMQSRSMSELITERTEIIGTTLMRVRPDVFLVDHAPIGMKGELRRPQELARSKLPDTQIVLGLRDVLDDPETVRRTWNEQGIYRVLVSFYDDVLVYGCRYLFDVTELYGFAPTVRRRTVFTGYIAKDYSLEPTANISLPWTQSRHEVRRVLVMGGGGGDAADLFNSFLGAWPELSTLGRLEAVLVTGPLMPVEVRSQISYSARRLARAHVVPSSRNMLQIISGADVVVSMGGYNSVVESLSARRPLVVFPRLAPRREQLIRARLLERLELARVVLPGPAAEGDLAIAVREALEGRSPSAEAWRRVDLRGGERVAQLLSELAREEVVSR